MDLSILNDILIEAVAALIIALSSLLCVFIKNKTQQLKIKTNNELIKKYLDIADSVVEDCVKMVSQTYVDNLKSAGLFDTQSQAEALQQCKDKTIELLSADSKEIIKEVYGDFDKWLSAKIESKVNQNKTTFLSPITAEISGVN